MTDEVVMQVTRGVAHITLNRPDVLNRFGGTMREVLLDLLGAATEDPDVRCVRITGAAPAFSAGADLQDMVALHHSGDRDEIRRRVAIGAAIVRSIRSMPEPVVAAVDGPAAGAGANLALACDIRIGSERAVFAQPFVGIGLIPDWGGFQSLTELVGRGNAAHLLMSGERVAADRALALGLLQVVVPTVDFEASSVDHCERLAAAPPGAIATIKAGLALAAERGSAGVAELELEMQPTLFGAPECLALMEGFLSRSSGARQATA
jgi:2-(1,2-epoxy-1,2-dihydrophenyl)acetyl-CoA isomerase